MKLPLGYLKQFSKLYGYKPGLNLYSNITKGKLNKLEIPQLNHSFELRDNEVDFKVFCQIFVNNEYNIQLDFKPQRIIDAGANIGLFTRYIKSRFPNSQICAIEPDEENFEVLERNLNQLNDITLLKKGLWSKKTKLDIDDPHGSGKWAMMVSENQHGKVEAIDVDSILRTLKWSRIDLFKIDIEGSEKELFESNYQNWLPKTKVLIIELHDWMKSGCSQSFFMALNNSINNYSLSILGENIVIVNNDLK